MPLDDKLAERGVCYLETVGRRTGSPHEIEIWFAAHPERERIYLLSGGRDRADWVLNLRRNSRARVRIAGHWFHGTGFEIEDEGEDLLARRLVAAKYQGWTEGRSLSSWARTSLAVAVDLVTDVAATPSG